MAVKMDEPNSVNQRIHYLEKAIAKEEATRNNPTNLLNLHREKNRLELHLDKLTHGLSISDHALVRYFERVMKMDVESVRQNLVKYVKKFHMGDGKYMIGDGVYAIIKGGVVATILDEPTEYKNGDR